MWFRNAVLAMWLTSLCVASALNTKVEAPLRDMYDAWKTNGMAGLQAEARKRAVFLHNGRICVRITMEDNETEDETRRTASRGGVHITAVQDGSIFGEITVNRLPRLAASDHIAGIYLDRSQRLPQGSKQE